MKKVLCYRERKNDASERSYLNLMGTLKARRGSLSDQKKPDIHNILLEHVRNNDIEKIKHTIHEHNELISFKYPHPYFKSIIPIARFNLYRQVNYKTVETLIDIGFQIYNAANKIDELIFFAAASGHTEKLVEVLDIMKKDCPESINNTREGDTALMFLIKYGNAASEHFTQSARILIEAGIDVNIPDYSNCSPIVRAAYLYHIHSKKPPREHNHFLLESFKDLIETLLNKNGVDIDSHRWYEKTAREYISLNNLHNVSRYPKYKPGKNLSVKSKLFSLTIAKNEDRLVDLKGVETYDLDDGENTLLQLACMLKLETAVKHFLKRGANPNLTTSRNKDHPLEMAAKRNHHNIFEILLNWKTTTIDEGLYDHFALYKGNKIKEKYFISLLHSKKLNVDLACKNGNTPLHYAAVFSEHEAVLSLLHRGASLVVENKSKERPIDYVDPRILRKFVNECIQPKATQNIYHKKSTLSFNYEFLLKNERNTPGNEETFVEIEDIDTIFANKNFVSETEVALTLSEFQEMRHLLKHPVISSFLYVKWYKIKAAFWLIMLFHSWCYSNFVYFFYYSSKYWNYEYGMSFPLFVVSYVLYISFIFVRATVTKDDLKMYFHIYIECALVLLVFITLCLQSLELRRHFSVFGIIFSAFSLIFWAGYHPKMSSHVSMLQRVSYNFFRILLCYCILIFAFGICFYILFNDYFSVASRNATVTEDPDSLFVSPGTSIFKAFVMMSGEFETSSFEFNKTNFSGYIVFLMFVFMISLILMNLLTGVAVTDTETAQNEAEIVGHISTIRFIRFVEMITQPGFLPRGFRRRHNFNQRFSLANSLEGHTLTIYPNMRGKVKCDPQSSLRALRLNKQIVKGAMNIVIKRDVKYNKLLDTEGAVGVADIELLKSKIDEIAEKQRVYYKKFNDSIETIANNLSIITENFEIVPDL